MKIITNHFLKVMPVILLGMLISVSNLQARELPDFTGLAEKHSPAVVNISTTQKLQSKKGRMPKGFQIPEMPEGSPFNEFFRRFFDEDGEQQQESEARSLGSGFIISKDGYIVTNNHVIRDADEVIVRLSDRRELVAEIVGSDARSDIALLKIKANDLPTLHLTEKTDLKVGEWVLAIGSPFGFDHSVTAGIVSAKGRSLPSENYVPFIQTDVAINPGNSGGPLFNLDGEVVGVNSQIYSRTGGFMGLSFAIPSEVVRDVVHQIKDKGHVSRGWLGVLIQEVNRDLAESFGMAKPSGALVAKILPDSPAEAAGFKEGDIVIAFNGTPIARSSELPPVVGRSPIGKKVPVKVLRRGKNKILKVKIAELPAEDELKVAYSGTPKSISSNKLDVAVTDLTPEQLEQTGSRDHGVLVKEVGSDGSASKAGIKTGDVLLMLNNEEIRDARHFKELVADLPEGRSVPILIQRQGSPIFLAMRVPEAE